MKQFGKTWAILFLPFTLIYSILSFIRNLMFDFKFIVPDRVHVPVISVGNVTVGGTGKTPVVAFLANALQEKGYSVGIVSRGYRRETTGTVWVANKGKIVSNALEGGDEPVELAAIVKNATIVVGDTRYDAAKELLKSQKVDAIIIDDGMQHRFFHRDYEIMVQDADSAIGWRFQLPSGRFRESWLNAKRADAIIWTKWNDEDLHKMSERWSPVSEIPQYYARFVSKSFFYVREKREYKLDEFEGKTGIAFCGIGTPEHFKRDLENLGIELIKFQAYPDHYSYKKTDILTLIETFNELGPDFIFTTAKDYHRLAATQTSHDFMKYLPCVYLKGDVQFIDKKDTFVQSVTDAIDSFKRHPL